MPASGRLTPDRSPEGAQEAGARGETEEARSLEGADWEDKRKNLGVRKRVSTVSLINLGIACSITQASANWT